MHTLVVVGSNLVFTDNQNIDKHILASFWDENDYYRYILYFLNLYNESTDRIDFYKVLQVRNYKTDLFSQFFNSKRLLLLSF